MLKKFSKKIAIIAAVMVLSVSILSVNAFAATPDANISPMANHVRWWLPVNSTPYGEGYVTGLVKGTDIGVKFTCTVFTNIGGSSDFDAFCEIIDRSLCKYYDGVYAGVSLDHVGDMGTDLFNDDWFALSNGTVWFRASMRNTTPGAQQYVEGEAF